MPSVPIASGDLTKRICRAKKIPREALRKFGMREETRNGKPVIRVDAYNCYGDVHSYFDMTDYGKGLNAPGEGSSGMFFPGRLPQPGETWYIVEGLKDAAALTELGYLACGTPGNHVPAKHARLFKDVNVVLVPDLDKAGFFDGKDKSGSNLFGTANSIKVARLPGPRPEIPLSSFAYAKREEVLIE
ncbi:replicative dna helicase protein [Rhodopirellula europaea 6C]|uniref:Replicative dna helicase protein n=1 Tax=Rhodopirellula europaea 6C TaxID=1263867 RepID=M2B765_9BACT|nr:replicative dna helicase protein [Rhodopirellula europaea 6C]